MSNYFNGCTITREMVQHAAENHDECCMGTIVLVALGSEESAQDFANAKIQFMEVQENITMFSGLKTVMIVTWKLFMKIKS